MRPEQVPLDTEEFWDDLLAFIEERRVIPVVGSELLTIEEDGASVPLYRAVAQRLLSKYRLSPANLPGGMIFREHHELNDAVSALAAAGKQPKDLYRPVNDILQQLLARQPEPLAALRELASIRHFDLFATTTPDDLLVRALNACRFEGVTQTDEIEYAPSLPTDRRRDIPELPSSNYTAVFYMFGKADVSPIYAIHEEDALEFAYTLQYTLQNGVPPARMFSELRSRSLLMIGCNFADWLSRFFLRLSNEKRLSSNERPKKEFLVDRAIGQEQDLTIFLEHFSRDSRFYPIGAREFVAELYLRWKQRNPPAPGQKLSSGAASPNPAPAFASGSVFISYASQDVVAAKKLLESIKEVGCDVVWLDKTELKAGDDWNGSIQAAVQRCDFFFPLISANTERRTEGYFRLEWTEAAERSRRIQGRKFIFPIVIDSDFASGMSAYSLMPDAFKAFQFSHAPGGEMSPGLRSEITEQLRSLRRGKTA